MEKAEGLIRSPENWFRAKPKSVNEKANTTLLQLK